MKVTDKENYAEVELETAAGQATFRAGMRGDGDRRFWNRDSETSELGQYLQQNVKQTQVVVKCGDTYSRVR
jgi:hypothetical protein